MSTNLSNASSITPNLNNFETISKPILSNDNVGCRTVTVGINIGIAFIETTVTICCCCATPLPHCWEIQRSSNNTDDNTIHLDVSNLNLGNAAIGNNYIDVVSSTNAQFNDYVVKIKTKRYYINGDNTVNLEYESN